MRRPHTPLPGFPAGQSAPFRLGYTCNRVCTFSGEPPQDEPKQNRSGSGLPLQNVQWRRQRDDGKEVEIHGLVTEYFEGLNWCSKACRGRNTANLVLFLGSSIGNFSRSEANAFLYNLWSALNHEDYVLIGFDLKKNIRRMVRAYNDAQGVTADFNRNLLRRINRELGGQFDLAAFDYFSTYNAAAGAVESSLISTRAQQVYVAALEQSFSFEPWEGIHTESSHKYVDSAIVKLARGAGFEVVHQAYDSGHQFVDSLWQVKKNGRPAHAAAVRDLWRPCRSITAKN